MNALQILKNSGKYEDFNIVKLKQSLIRSGVDEAKADQIAKKIKQKCSQGYSSKKLYRMAYNLIKKESRLLACKYSMTKAISELGPDGYHFERFVATIFEKQGYLAKTNYFAEGRCVKHEIDVKLEGKKNIYCECKFHNNPNTKNDLKITLYVKARYTDLLENPENALDEFLLVSNTKFSKDAIEYSNCAGLSLLGPNAPHKQALSELAVKNKVFPTSSITSLKKRQAKRLIEKGFILAEDILNDPSCMKMLSLSDDQEAKILKEIQELLKK